MVGSWKMVIGDNCNTMFYFDGKFIREASSHRCLSPVNYANEAEIYFTSTCTSVVLFQYDVEESDLSFSNAPTYSIHSMHGYTDPGTTMIVYNSIKKFTIGKKGKEVCQNKISTTGTSNCIPHILCNVITCPCPRDLLLTQHSSR